MQKILKMLPLLFLSACGYHIDKTGEPVAVNTAALSFAEVQSRILGPRCARCHGGDVMASYESVVANLPEITRRIQLKPGASGAMPPGGTALSPGDAAAILAWAASGAPRETGRIGELPPVPAATPAVPPPDPVPPAPFSFAKVRAEVFIPRCARCHSGMVGTYEKVIANLSAIENKIASGEMPPARAAALTEAEKQLVLRWIALGAPEAGESASKLNLPPGGPARPCTKLIRREGGDNDTNHSNDDANDDRCEEK